MLLGNYFDGIHKNYKKLFFSGISFNTRSLKKNNIFFAIKGNSIDGNKFISKAIEKGSKIIVTEQKIKDYRNGILFIRTKNIRKLLAEVSFKIYNKIPKNLVAVTGTNGKSSVAEFYLQIMQLNKKKVASIGTLGVKSKNINLNLFNTTTDPINLGQILQKLKKEKVDNVIMEASSHGLKQYRLDGLKFKSGIFTNLSQDHLDYHNNFQNYLKSKLYLFEKLIKKKGNIITDEKIPEFGKIKKIAIKKRLNLLTINNKKNNFQIVSHFFKGESQIIEIKIGKVIHKINLNLIGKIQLKNLIMAIIAANQSQIEIEKILDILPKIKSVEGRFQKIGKLKNNSKIILDYAHTPEALKTSLQNLREQFPFKKISLLFGCGGNRDKDKRSKMGRIADQFSDKIYLTDDNPRFENPIEIRKDIKKGIKKKKIIEISNRAKAISYAIKNIQTGEILLIAGKGHEKTQVIGKRTIYFSDKDFILKSIKVKNLHLSKDLKINIIKDLSNQKSFDSKLSLRKGRINSKDIKKNDIFFAIKGKKNDGSKFLNEAYKKKSSLLITHKLNKNISLSRQVKVKDTLKFLTDSAQKYRNNIDTTIIGITGSCGKTTLKQLLGQSLSKISETYYSPKSYNNKFGVPISLLNLKQNKKFGVFEIGMDKKGEINFLSKILKPSIGIITNISYAHSKNFKNINEIAEAKSEIIDNIMYKGSLILNKDDKFYNFLSAKAAKKKLRIFSFSLKEKNCYSSLLKIIKINNKFKISFLINSKKFFYYSYNNSQNHIQNLLASLTTISLFFDLILLISPILLFVNE